jgi:hypothetical protein
MKRILILTFIIISALMLGPLAAYAGEGMGPPITHSTDFEKMKTLVGVWEGKGDMGKGMASLKITYELTSAGNAILERFGADTPHEMVTVYYDYAGTLGMTHYCSLGNQPHMELTNPGENTLAFVLSGRTPGLTSLNEMHMHALTIALNNKDTITQTWTLYDKGVKVNDVAVTLTRTKM